MVKAYNDFQWEVLTAWDKMQKTGAWQNAPDLQLNKEEMAATPKPVMVKITNFMLDVAGAWKKERLRHHK